MGTSTPHLNLYKPDPGDDVDVEQDLGENYDKLDASIEALDEVVPTPFPRAHLYQTSANTHTFANGIDEAIIFDGELLDTINAHSNVTNNTRYTPTVPGWYKCYGQFVTEANANGNRACHFRKNGSRITGTPYTGIRAPTGSDVVGTAISAGLVNCNGVTDYIEFWGYQSSGGDLNSYSDSLTNSFAQIEYWGPL